ncbi:hypothetical protein HPP92_013861 [Vanilla planifolia]|uniref:Uncharacterized protein n=1 Tax=Vanilla planifolia TaxID=51239 RepID=A0A835R4B3_VANPL|nr:hypothetical protein HPP92_013861 [Vanilla planifolia]
MAACIYMHRAMKLMLKKKRLISVMLEMAVSERHLQIVRNHGDNSANESITALTWEAASDCCIKVKRILAGSEESRGFELGAEMVLGSNRTDLSLRSSK